MEQPTKSDVYKLLNQVLDKNYSNEVDPVGILKDLFVECFFCENLTRNEVDEEIAELMKIGTKKIQAIVLAREKYKMGLVEAKSYVEKIESELGLDLANHIGVDFFRKDIIQKIKREYL